MSPAAQALLERVQTRRAQVEVSPPITPGQAARLARIIQPRKAETGR